MKKAAPVKKQSEFKLDIFALISRLNKSELGLWDTLSEEERKGFSTYIVTRWMSGTKDQLQIILLDEFVNSALFNLGTKQGFTLDHNELLCKLLACCGMDDNRRFTWVPESKKTSNKPMTLDVVKEYYGFTTREAKSQIPLLSGEDVIQLAEELGYQVDEIKLLKKEVGIK